ncbi:cobalamin biosynthetic protein CobC [Azospirillum fermentarium]|uniref:threonine-phosphate decarboxylase CobD n=1 Tax=Azospirillum fermentarium TaxID=1233114 RepID=UPI002227FFCC|nr:threonine-phosphate decarboxylase CobD [Azospirillum fermentarium]MCW2246753.1 cobalamin biosynthetic protein CobC [Azospirillum fermentarium]
MAETTVGTKDEPILHGGDLDAARAAFPGAHEPWLDLSTGINPRPYPLPPLATDAWTRLPGRGEEEGLRRAAAGFYGAPSPDHVAAAPGSQALIQLLPRLRPPGTVAVLGPTYAEHAQAWAQAGHRVRTVAGLDELADADVAVVVNPNNPDGRILPPDTLSALAARRHAAGGWLVVDEAFAEVTPQASIAPRAGMPGLVVIRSFGKFFGLAGVRLGFVLAAPALAGTVSAAVGPWAVAGPALAIGTAALNDAAWAQDTRRWLEAAARRLDGVLAGAGLAVAGGTSLFRLAEDHRAPEFYSRLGRAGILVRRFADHPTRLRFGLPPDSDGERRLYVALAAK